jgi:hypothetical protein
MIGAHKSFIGVLVVIACSFLATAAFAQNKEAEDQKIDPSKTKTSQHTEGDNQITQTDYFNKSGAPVKTEKTTVTPQGKTEETDTYKDGKPYNKTTTTTDNFGKLVEKRDEYYNKDGVIVTGTIIGPKTWKVFNRDTGKYEDWKPEKPFSYVPWVGEKPKPLPEISPERPTATPAYKSKGESGETGKTTGMAPPTKPTLNHLIWDGSVEVASRGTGETIGHIADLKIHNRTNQLITFVIQAMILESINRMSQDYACPHSQDVTLAANDTKIVPIDGVCLERDRPPVGKDGRADLVINTGDPAFPENPTSHIHAEQARTVLRFAEAKYKAAEKLQKDGELKDLPYKDKQKQKEIVEQWSTWCDPRISEITGAPPATKDDLKKIVYKQAEEKRPMTPATKKKIDQGIDTIFEKIELTTTKAKDLEQSGAATETAKLGTCRYQAQSLCSNRVNLCDIPTRIEVKL